MTPGVVGLVVLVVAVTGMLQPGLAQHPLTPAASGEPDAVELITDPQLPEPAPSRLRRGRLGRPRGRAPLGVPVSGEEFARAKAAAVADPDLAAAAVAADDIEEFSGPEPLGHTINADFPGLNMDTAQSGGSNWYPPDTIVAGNSTRVLEATNSAVRLFTTSGGVLDTKTLNAFFSASSSTFEVLFDPKVYYDRVSANQRFFIVALSLNSATKVSRIWFAVSRSKSPTSLDKSQWCRYSTDGRRNKGTANDSWADYPGIGFGKDAFVIKVNNFTWSAFSFTYTFVRTMRKLVLENNASGCPGGSSAALKVFQASSVLGDGSAFNLEPVQHYTAPPSFAGVTNPVYLLATEYGSSSDIRLWRVANAAGTATFAGPFLLPGGLPFGIPPDSPQQGAPPAPLHTGDNRITQAAGLSNVLHGVFATTCNIGGGAVEACIRYVRVQVAGPALSGAYQQQITFGGKNLFYWWPGVAVNLDKKVLLVYQRGGSSIYLSAGYTGKTDAATIFEPHTSLTNGTCTWTLYRTGDYVGAHTDPGGKKFWLAGERATLIGPLGCAWETWIRKITPP